MALERVRSAAEHFFSKSAWLSSIYYAFFSRAFRREHHGVLRGIVQYSKNGAASEETSPLLRRNIHRLEKGLLMRPMREVFALDYIGETAQCYFDVVAARQRNGHAVSEELQWARDVLQRYFSATGSHPVIDDLRTRFDATEHPAPGPDQCRIPYRRDLTKPPSIAYEDFLELARRRRSVRWFLKQKVPRELIDKAIQAAALSPSACNRQPFHFRIFDEPELVKRVASLPMGTSGYSDNIPTVVVVLGKLENFFIEKDRHLIYIDGSLAAMSFAYALECLGLSTCMINWPDVEGRERKMARALSLRPDERPIMLIAVGYPDPEGLVAASIKKPLHQLRSFNFETSQEGSR